MNSRINVLWVSDYKRPMDVFQQNALVKAAQEHCIPIHSMEDANIIVKDRMEIFNEVESNFHYGARIADIALQNECRVIILNYPILNNIRLDVISVFCNLVQIGQIVIVPNIVETKVIDPRHPNFPCIKYVQEGWTVVDDVIPQTHVVK